MPTSADAVVLLNRTLLADLLQLPDGMRVVGLEPADGDDALLRVDVVFGDGPMGAHAPLQLIPRYARVDASAGGTAVALLDLQLH